MATLTNPLSLLLLLTTVIALHATSQAQDDMAFPSFTEESCNSLPALVCIVTPTANNSANGVVMFTPSWERRNASSSLFTCYTKISADILDLTPSSEHGFHIHTYGDLSQSNGSSTGGHFTNPAGDDMPHGYPDHSVRHWGDFGNLAANAAGVANYERTDTVIRLGGIVGRSITIHADSDQGVAEQPSGGSGSRIAFGVIGYANPGES